MPECLNVAEIRHTRGSAVRVELPEQGTEIGELRGQRGDRACKTRFVFGH